MVIAAAQMGELVDDQGRALVIVETLPECPVGMISRGRQPSDQTSGEQLAVDPPDRGASDRDPGCAASSSTHSCVSSSAGRAIRATDAETGGFARTRRRASSRSRRSRSGTASRIQSIDDQSPSHGGGLRKEWRDVKARRVRRELASISSSRSSSFRRLLVPPRRRSRPCMTHRREPCETTAGQGTDTS